MTLGQLSVGQRAQITEVIADEALTARMFCLGLRRGREMAMIRKARLKGPLQVRVSSTDLIIRRSAERRITLISKT